MIDSSLLSFSSQFRYERINNKNHVAFSLNTFGGSGSGQTINIDHNLGYKPYVKLFYGFGGGTVYPLFSGFNSYNIAGNELQIEEVFINTVNITVVIQNYSVTNTINGFIYYRIYEEPLT